MHEGARYWAGRPVAITGATGFIGHHLAMQLVQQGARVSALVRTPARCGRLAAAGVRCVLGGLDDMTALTRTCRGCEIVFHVAGAVDFEADWERFQRVNIDGTRNVAEAARGAGVRRLVHTSSIVAVGAARRPQPLDESAAWNLGPLSVPYVTSKRTAEELVLAEEGLEVVVVNPASVVGPDDFTASEFGTVCRRFWRGRLPFHFGGGNNFVDVRDVAAGHLLAAERGRPGERYILGGHNRSYGAFFKDLARAAARPILRVPVPAAVGTVVAQLNDRFRGRRPSRSYLTVPQARLLKLFFYFDSGKAARELGYRPRPFDDSVADTYQFWMARKRA